MGTHPIFESDFDCLTDHKMQQEQQSGDSGALSQSTFLPTPALSSTPAKGADAVNEKAGGKGFDADIGHLNSRLATIVDRNNGIQSENQRLREKLGSVQDAHGEELERVKTMYEKEIGEARRLLDLESNRKVGQELELKNIRLELKELQEEKQTHVLNEKTAKDLAEQLQAMLDKTKGELQTIKRKHQSAQSDKAELTMQLTSAKSDLEKAKKDAETIDIKRLQLENDIQSIQEQMAMNKKVYDQEMSSQKEVNHRALSQSMQEQSMVANATMSRAIEDIRQEHEDQLEKMQGEYEKKYQKRHVDMQKKVEKGQKVLDEKRKECSTQKALADQAKTQLSRTERELAKAKDELRTAEAEVASQRATASWNMDDLKVQNDEMKSKLTEMDDTLNAGKEKYGTLLKEVETYRSLLEVEENRLNITPSPVQTKKRSRSRVGTLGGSETASPPKKARVSEPQVEDVGADQNGGDADASCAIM